MSKIKNTVSLLALTGALSLAVSACSSSDGGTEEPDGATTVSQAPRTTGSGGGTAPSDGTTTPSGSTTTAGEAGPDCYIHLYDDDNFKDTNFKLTEPGSYKDLKSLPGAGQDWTDEADSVRVGSGATVTIWSETDFAGESMKLDPGSDHADLDEEPSSFKMTC